MNPVKDKKLMKHLKYDSTKALLAATKLYPRGALALCPKCQIEHAKNDDRPEFAGKHVEN